MYRYTACKAFRQLLQELGDFAGQREVVAENLQSNVVREVHLLAKELREERKVPLCISFTGCVKLFKERNY